MSETTRHRLAFDAYWQLGPDRSLDGLHRCLQADPKRYGFQHAPSRRTLAEWSRRYGWRSQLDRLEADARRDAHAAKVRAVAEMNDRQAALGVELQQKAIDRLRDASKADLTNEASLRMLVEGVKMERLARGTATERYEQDMNHDKPDLTDFSDDELRAIARLAARDASGAESTESERPTRLG